MKFFDAYDNKPIVDPQINTGPLEPIYGISVDEDGEEHLEVIGHTNTDEAIQSHFDECDLPTLLAKCAATGNYDLLHTRTPVYGDVCGIPRDYTDAHRRMQYAHNHFNSLPDDIRNLYDDFDDFAMQALKNEPSKKVIDYYNNLAAEAAAVESVVTSNVE